MERFGRRAAIGKIAKAAIGTGLIVAEVGCNPFESKKNAELVRDTKVVFTVGSTQVSYFSDGVINIGGIGYDTSEYELPRPTSDDASKVFQIDNGQLKGPIHRVRFAYSNSDICKIDASNAKYTLSTPIVRPESVLLHQEQAKNHATRGATIIVFSLGQDGKLSQQKYVTIHDITAGPARVSFNNAVNNSTGQIENVSFTLKRDTQNGPIAYVLEEYPLRG